MFDDHKQHTIIQENNDIIRNSQENISKALSIIEKNKEYKSILYTSGDELVKIVFNILNQMINCDLSNFVDNKKEDFLFEIEGYVYIGEIKGVNHNVKSENISQLDVHYQGYIDENPEINSDKIKAILIINHQRNKPIESREPVHERQIELAKRNGSLIIETITLLKVFEQYLGGDFSRNKCLSLITNNTGLLQL